MDEACRRSQCGRVRVWGRGQGCLLASVMVQRRIVWLGHRELQTAIIDAEGPADLGVSRVPEDEDCMFLCLTGSGEGAGEQD